MHIQEKNGKWLNFFTPAVIPTITGILIAFTTIPFLLVDGLVSIFGDDMIIANVRIGLLSQILGTALVFFLVIPFVKVRNAKYKAVSGTSTLQTVLIFCLSFAIYGLSNIFFALVYSVLDQTPQTGYGAILLTADHLADPFNIILFFGMGAVVGPLFEEYIMRRTLIPLLEERGMAPIAAVLASSILFAVGHVPNDLLNANMSGTMAHFWGVFVIGFACGIAYILTRNVLYPTIIHGLYNGLSFSAYLFQISENVAVLTVYGLFISATVILGLVVWMYAIRKYRKSPSEVEWVHIVREKSEINIVPGLLGFIGIYIALTTILLIVPLSVLVLTGNGRLTILTDIGVQVLFLVVLVWFVTKTEYVGLTEPVDPTEPVAGSQSTGTS